MPNNSRAEKLEALGRIIDTLDILRVKCPWDAKQTNESLRPNTIEEVYELTQALMDNNSTEIRKELGDVLLHILFYAKSAMKTGSSTLQTWPMPSTTNSYSAIPTFSATQK